MERLGIIVTRPERYLARTLYSLKPTIVSVYLWRTDCYLWQSSVVQSIIVIKDKTMAPQFSYQLCLALWPGCLQTVQLRVLLPFSPRDPVLMFSSQQTQHSGPPPVPPVPRSHKTNIFLQPLTKGFQSFLKHDIVFIGLATLQGTCSIPKTYLEDALKVL